MAIDDLTLENLTVEFQIDDGKGGKKTVRMRWGDFMKSDKMPKDHKMMMLEAKSNALNDKRGK